ncbi:hypothetical protein BH18VER1_BH18VER1_10630 [soil metagenome]
MDAVGYSTLPLDEQVIVFRRLQEIVNECQSVTDAARDGEVVRTPTGDGMALTFFDDCARPLRCAIEFAEKMDAERSFTVRMGIHSGNVVRQLDVNGNVNVSGDGINIAQRVMDFGDGGHILMSLQHATELQQAGDPAAEDCHDIGIASAKHGQRVHLFNYYRPAVGAAEVPVNVRKDDQWTRPTKLRLGTSGKDVFTGTLQILGWLLSAPSKWRTHVTQIDPRLAPNFSIVDVTGAQIRRNRDLRQLLLQVYGICPAMLGLLIWVFIGVIAGEPGHAFAWIGMMIVMGYLATLLLCLGAGFVGFVILTFQSLVQGIATELFGFRSVANMIAVSLLCGWGFIALSAVFPVKRNYSIGRELVTAIAAALFVLILWATPLGFVQKASPLHLAGVMAATSFLLLNATIGVRWRRWSRGFALGQVFAVLIGALWFTVGMDAEGEMPKTVAGGLLNGLTSGVIWSATFALAERISGARAAVAAGMFVTALLNILTAPGSGGWVWLPLVTLVVTYLINRKRVAASGSAG